MAWIRHDSGHQTTIKNEQALGSASPLQTDEDGYAEIDDEEAAEMLVILDGHIDFADPPTEDDSLDAETFVDRTPMADVIDDLETGEYDDYLDAIESAADRQGVIEAVEARREA